MVSTFLVMETGTDGCLVLGLTLSEVLCCIHVCLLCVKQQLEHRPKEPVFLMVKIHMMHILPQASRNHVHLIK